MNVGRRFSSPVITVSPDMPVPEALALMQREKIRHAPVVKKGKMVGIVTKNDLMNASPSKATTLSVWEVNYLLNKIKVEDVMTHNVITVTEDTPIEEAARIMADNKISCLPVMRGEELAGIITESDIFKLFLELLGAREKGVRITVEVSDRPGTLAQITQAIYEAGGNIIALGAFAGETVSTSFVTIKVENIEKESLRKIIEPLVVRVTDLRVM
ncbi:MAG: CBS and ACT domain-containing protein [Anaerolineales bacterium]|nr:CBS and ACT domain-containing protein [Anaerolineales bacterium]MDW8228022.1 CBS and ACT domain-containing protein [Anaerolineales bacterium]